MAKHVFHFGYPVYPHNPRRAGGTTLLWDRDLHRIRDGHAMLELMDVLRDAGFVWGDTLLNLSWGRGDGKAPPISGAPSICRQDLIVATTRCPLNDSPLDDRKAIVASGTPLEALIFHTLRECFFEECSRAVVSARGSLRTLFVANKERPTIDFISRRGVGADGHAYGFLAYAPWLLAPSGTVVHRKLLLSFGMGGVENLLWARSLRRIHRRLLLHVLGSRAFWFVLGKWKPVRAPARPSTLAFSDQIRPRISISASCVAPHRNAPWHNVRFQPQR